MTSSDFDVCLQVVADRRRRRLLRQLRADFDGAATIQDLADSLAADGSVAGDDPPDREQLLTELHHNHLPSLAKHDIVKYDPRSGAVRYASDDAIEAVLDVLPDEFPIIEQ